MGMDVKTLWKEGWEHTYPNDVQGHEDLNAFKDCSMWNDIGSNYCGFDLAKEYLSHLLKMDSLKERVVDEAIYQ
jgi:hypothetical protein